MILYTLTQQLIAISVESENLPLKQVFFLILPSWDIFEECQEVHKIRKQSLHSQEHHQNSLFLAQRIILYCILYCLEFRNSIKRCFQSMIGSPNFSGHCCSRAFLFCLFLGSQCLYQCWAHSKILVSVCGMKTDNWKTIPNVAIACYCDKVIKIKIEHLEVTEGSQLGPKTKVPCFYASLNSMPFMQSHSPCSKPSLILASVMEEDPMDCWCGWQRGKATKKS